MKKIFALLIIIACIFIGTYIYGLFEPKPIDYNKVFHDTGITLYQENVLSDHYNSCRQVAYMKKDKELGLDCYNKATILGVFKEPYLPYELFYTYTLNSGAYISQTPQDHFKANSILATDVATGGKPMQMYAPDMKNEVVTYTVTYDENYKEHYGTALVLTSGLERFVIGHIDISIASDTIKTGEPIGTTSLAGISTGYHAHIEYWTGVEKDGAIVWSQSDYKIDPNYNPHNRLLTSTYKSDEQHLPAYSEMYKGFNTPWQIISAKHFFESGRQVVQIKTSTAGAKGQMQFLPCTWFNYGEDPANPIDCFSVINTANAYSGKYPFPRGYGVDGDGDGIADINNLKDAIASTDNYYQANYKKSGSRIKAIWHYNNSDYYVRRVLREAQNLGLELDQAEINFINKV